MALARKRHPKFNVPNFGAKSRSRVPERWRKQRGIDNKKRIKKDFAGAEPTIGYGNPASLRGVRANGRRAVLVANMAQLREVMGNPEMRGWDVTMASSLSKRKRAEIAGVAVKGGVHVTNGA